jgi:pimeloyl-ACP methyl ester carboxylesterase
MGLPDPSHKEAEMQIAPFTVDVPQGEVDDLVARIANTRWPSDVVADWSRGVPASYAQKLAHYWANEYDWPAQQAFLNTFTQFTTSVENQTVHFVHVRSSVEGATPLLLLHGYPSSFVEFSRMIGPLVDPAAHGARAEDAFHVVVPSPPGFSFSTPLSSPGWDIRRTATAFDQIMAALGYERYGVHGGDVGAGLAEQLCILGGNRVIGSLVVTDPGAIATEFTPPTDHSFVCQSSTSELVLENAFREAVKAGTKAVDTDHIFPALLYDENGESAAAFRNVGVHLRELRRFALGRDPSRSRCSACRRFRRRQWSWKAAIQTFSSSSTCPPPSLPMGSLDCRFGTPRSRPSSRMLAGSRGMDVPVPRSGAFGCHGRSSC